MVFGPFDYRPNVNIPPDVFSSLANRYSGGYNAFTQQYDEANKKAMERLKQNKWQQAINDLLNNPNVPQQAKNFAPLIAQQPELAGQILPELLKIQQGKPEWSAVSGMQSKTGRPLEIDKFTGEIREAGPEGAKSTGYGATMGPYRWAQGTLSGLPSNQGPSTAGGAAYQVKVGARQGMNLIARPGSPQRTAAAQADLVRSITRVAPTDEGLRNANFSTNLITRWSQVKQSLTADPTQVDNPKIRKEMYDIFKEMDESATPFIQEQLDNLSDLGFQVSPNIRNRELGKNLSVIPFVETMKTNTLGQATGIDDLSKMTDDQLRQIAGGK